MSNVRLRAERSRCERPHEIGFRGMACRRTQGPDVTKLKLNIGVRRMPRGLRQVALSISCLSPIVRRPDAFVVTKIASLIFRPDRRFLALTSFQSLRRPSLSFGSSSVISLRRQSLSLSRARLRPPGNIHSPSRFRLTRSTCLRFVATSFEDLAIYVCTIRVWHGALQFFEIHAAPRRFRQRRLLVRIAASLHSCGQFSLAYHCAYRCRWSGANSRITLETRLQCPIDRGPADLEVFRDLQAPLPSSESRITRTRGYPR